jgi:CheY-like chemotaxis protein
LNTHILVVDDEPDVEALFRQQFRRELRAQLFVMEFASSATDALARVASTTTPSPSLIFSDVNMPGMTGLEMLPKIKALYPGLPVIMTPPMATPIPGARPSNRVRQTCRPSPSTLPRCAWRSTADWETVTRTSQAGMDHHFPQMRMHPFSPLNGNPAASAASVCARSSSASPCDARGCRPLPRG